MRQMRHWVPESAPMPDITFIEFNGTAHTVDASEGLTVMQAADGAGIPGIVAECGGRAMCSTCHVFVDDAWIARLPDPEPEEWDRLDYTAVDRGPGSRLACQIRVRADLHGLVLRLPERQL
jgi:ferredoxin, 2Fe-2S